MASRVHGYVAKSGAAGLIDFLQAIDQWPALDSDSTRVVGNPRIRFDDLWHNFQFQLNHVARRPAPAEDIVLGLRRLEPGY